MNINKEYNVLDFIKKSEMKISYDYEELLQELKDDIVEFNIGLINNIYIVRDELNNTYQPIIDYYFEDDEIDNVKFVYETTVSDVLDEMIYLNDNA